MMMISSKKYLAIASIGPYDGLLSGFNEGKLIADFEAGAAAKRGTILPREFPWKTS